MRDMPSAILLAHIETWVAELEREVRAFEAAVDEVEERMEQSEQASACGGDDGHSHLDQHMRQLDCALETANHIAELVMAANATLTEGIDAAQQVIANEHVGAPTESLARSGPVAEPQSNALEAQFNATASKNDQVTPQHIIKARLVLPRSATVEPGASVVERMEPLSHGAIILQGRYRIVELLHARPRVNIYLGYRLPRPEEAQQQDAAPASLVAIRELVLTGLSTKVQMQVEHAAFEEFVSPAMLGSPRLPGVGDRVSIEHERHYLVMQLRPTRGERQSVAVPLAELLLTYKQWPAWLDMETALEWSIQLCRIVARLHRMGVVLGNLDPSTILVDSGAASTWAPVLLVSWPPALQFWSPEMTRERYTRLFPIAEMSIEHAFAAPEVFTGQCYECSDIYSLGAILYLLFTRYAPVAAVLRQSAEHRQQSSNGRYHSNDKQPFGSGPLDTYGGILLVPPHLFNNRIQPRLETVLTRALALHPAERFPTVFALVEALESIDSTTDFVDPFVDKQHVPHDSKVTKVLEWVRREIKE